MAEYMPSESLAKARSGLAQHMANRQVYHDRLMREAREREEKARKPSFGKFLGGAVQGGLTGFLASGFNPLVGLAGAGAGGLMSSGLLGEDVRAATPGALRLGGMALAAKGMGGAGAPKPGQTIGSGQLAAQPLGLAPGQSYVPTWPEYLMTQSPGSYGA